MYHLLAFSVSFLIFSIQLICGLSPRVQEVVASLFKDVSEESIAISLLTGRCTMAENYKIDVAGSSCSYVLRFFNESDTESVERELYAMKEASVLRVGPQVFYTVGHKLKLYYGVY